MQNRRWAIVAGLGVVELWIVGLILRSLAGDGHGTVAPLAAQAVPSTSSVRAGTVIRTIEAGSAPDVVIDDSGDAALTVTVRSGAAVSVVERSGGDSWMHPDERPVTIERTANGVRISRQSEGIAMMFGSFSRQLDVTVPPQARLNVRNAGSISVAGLQADATLHSDDGAIVVRDHRGNLSATTDNGRVELSEIKAPSIEATSDNGRISFDRVAADRATVKTDDGRIEIARSLLRGGRIETDNGRVALALDPQSDVMIRARAASGNVVAAAPLTVSSFGSDENAPAMVRIGTGAGRLDVASDDGSISIQALKV